MSDVLEHLRTSDPAADVRGWSRSSKGEAVRERITPMPHRRRNWLLAVAAAVVVLALVVGIAVVTTATDTTPVKPVSDIQRLVHGKWHRLPDSPFGAVGRAQMFSTSKGILVWAEYSDSGTPPGFHLASYDPSAKKWKRLAEPPVVLTTEQEVWTGRDLVFPKAALAYDLRRDEWRSIAPAPVEVGDSTLLTWASSAVYVVNESCDACVQPYPPPGASAAYDPAADSWTVVASPRAGIANYAIGWSGRWLGVWGKSRVDPSGSLEMMGANGFWQAAIGYSKPESTSAAALVRVLDSLVWVHWDDRAAVVEWQRSRSPELVDVGRPLPYRDICAVDAWPGPRGSAIVQCNRGDRLRLLDVAQDRWLGLPQQPNPIVTSVWTGRDLYAITTDGGLLVLR